MHLHHLALDESKSSAACSVVTRPALSAGVRAVGTIGARRDEARLPANLISRGIRRTPSPERIDFGVARRGARQNELPEAPLKREEKRAANWQALMGVEQTEIDYLVLLAPCSVCVSSPSRPSNRSTTAPWTAGLRRLPKSGAPRRSRPRDPSAGLGQAGDQARRRAHPRLRRGLR